MKIKITHHEKDFKIVTFFTISGNVTCNDSAACNCYTAGEL